VKNKRHPHACTSALAARAPRSGKFWAFHDLAYKNQHQLGAANLRQYASRSASTRRTFEACVLGASALRGDPRRLGTRRPDAVHGTPRIYINGNLYPRRLGGGSGRPGARGGAGEELDRRADGGEVAPRRDRGGQIPADVPSTPGALVRALKFSIDTFEAGLQNGAASSGKHQIPATRMSWFAARDACTAAGKRLCTEQEWVSACQGTAASTTTGTGSSATT